MSKRTTLYDQHTTLGARIVEFAGWNMPVQYSGIIDEHNTVRNAVGLFDVSHMGEVFISGTDSLDFLQSIVPQDVSKLITGKALYCQLLNNNGGIIDDFITYKLDENKYLLILNASRVDVDWTWLNENKSNFNITLENKSDEYSLMAIQGPKAAELLEKMGISKPEQPETFFIKNVSINGSDTLLARTGYTGEDGFEVLVKNESAESMWNYILEKGKEFGIKPIGLGARDTLRLEAGMLLYGNDMDEKTTPIDAKLTWSVSKTKTQDYNGKAKIFDQIQSEKGGADKKLIGFKMTEKAIPRHEYEIYYNGEKTGIVTSGGYSPTLDENIGLGYVSQKNDIGIGTTIQIMVRNKLYNAVVVKTPFIEKKNR